MKFDKNSPPQLSFVRSSGIRAVFIGLALRMEILSSIKTNPILLKKVINTVYNYPSWLRNIEHSSNRQRQNPFCSHLLNCGERALQLLRRYRTGKPVSVREEDRRRTEYI